ncbi:hypothetical protein BD414DRAFT_433472 [Trametes punicea]|nr:hypothetical protein BD414DRAFT_433472 [Trametes punicea]
MTATLDHMLSVTADITDSSDFPEDAAAPGLRALDDALRCDICRDFYDAPVSLGCGHTFCSACIRSALPVSATCPSCRKAASEVHLRKNVAMERAVQEWRKARPLMLRLAKEESERKTRLIPATTNARLRSAEPPRKRKRSGSPGGPSDDEFIVVPSSSSPILSGSATPDALPDIVECPICQKMVPSTKINMHIDSDCKRHAAEGGFGNGPTELKGKQKQQWSKLFDGPGAGSSIAVVKGKKVKGKARTKDDDGEAEVEHIPKVAYDIHPQKRIAEMLSEWGLPTHGDKNALVRRHSKWVILYNANVDRAPENRRTLDQLRNDLRKLEEAEQKTRKETVDDPLIYQRANKAMFAKLTEAARPKKGVKKDGVETAPDDVSAAPQLAVVKADTDDQTKDVIDVDSS